MLRVSDCVADCVWFSVPQPTKRQYIGNQIDAVMIFARADFVNTKTGISKLYFAELPVDVRERYHYDSGKAAAYAVQQAAVQQAAAQQATESMKQQKGVQEQQGERAAKQQNIQALQNDYQVLLQLEQDLLVEIGRVKDAQENARRKWVTRPWGYNEPQPYQYQTDAAEANLPLLEGRLENVRDEKRRVREQLARAQRESR